MTAPSLSRSAEFLRIAAASRERGVDVVAVPGPADLVRLDSFQSHVGAGRWWFLHRECAFFGLPGGPELFAGFPGGRGAGADQYHTRPDLCDPGRDP